MIRIIKLPKIFALFAILLFFSSCEDYLDKEETERLTFEEVWEKRSTTLSYFHNVWSFMPNEFRHMLYEKGWDMMSDDGSSCYLTESIAYFAKFNRGAWSPSEVPGNPYDHYYKGIREATIFILNIDKCTADNVTKEEIKMWKAQARFARAYYHFLLMRLYGPIILVKDELIDFRKTLKELERPRNTWKECVDYVTSELNEAASNLSSDYPPVDDEYGLATKGLCYAVISRLKLYAARPLFNGNALYKDIKNPDGTYLFPKAYDNELWKEAADAAKRVIDLGVYSLHKASDKSGNIDPIQTYKDFYQKTWLNEIIFARYEEAGWIRRHFTPTGVKNSNSPLWGGVGPTQQLVDAFAMKNGRYPITGYNGDGSPIIDPASGYTETGFSTFTNPSNNNTDEFFNMYKDREPRFYINVFWSSDKWYFHNEVDVPVFASGGNSGGGGNSQYYPLTGYMLDKFMDHTLKSKTGSWGYCTYPVFRLAEIYLNYAEALNEYSGPSAEVLKYVNEIRERAGLPNLESVYPEAASNKEVLRELIRKERRIELTFEKHRYFDTRTWMIAEKTNNGPIYGMNIHATTKYPDVTPPDFWKRVVYENRVFEKKHYLYPFNQEELDRNTVLVQNYGW